mgnify:CR=1 FL=1
MSKLASIVIADVKEDFEGGSSLSVSWDRMLVRGAENVLDKIKPKTLNRSVPIYGGLTGLLQYYRSPDDVLVPIGIFDNTGEKLFSYLPPKQFREHPDRNDVFTIETVNGLQMLRLRKDLATSSLVISECDAVGSITGTVTPTLNTFNYKSGSGSLQVGIDDTLRYFGDTFSTPQNMTSYLEGNSIVPIYVTDKSKVSTVQLELRTDGSNYYTLTFSTAYMRNGWNDVSTQLAEKVATGTPNIASIASWRMNVQAVTGQTTTLLFDRITLQTAKAYFFNYVSNKVFIDGVTGEWKDDVAESVDYVNFDRDLLGILHYEMCVLVDQAISKKNTGQGQAKTSGFIGLLKTKYAQYWEKFPSEEEPLSYSISPEIDKTIDDTGGVISYNLSEE